jgi:hypothetical protein
VSDEPTILDRLISAGISEERARDHLAVGRIRLDGEVVTDPATPAPPGTRPVVTGQ